MLWFMADIRCIPKNNVITLASSIWRTGLRHQQTYRSFIAVLWEPFTLRKGRHSVFGHALDFDWKKDLLFEGKTAEKNKR